MIKSRPNTTFGKFLVSEIKDNSIGQLRIRILVLRYVVTML